MYSTLDRHYRQILHSTIVSIPSRWTQKIVSQLKVTISHQISSIMAFPLQQVPIVPLGIIASQLDDDSFRNLRRATQAIPHMLATNNTEFGLRFCRNLDVIVLGTSLRTTNNHLSPNNASRVSVRGNTWGRQVKSINFRRGNNGEALIAQNARVAAITTLLSRTPTADTVFIRTHTQVASGVLFPALQQTPITTSTLR